MGILFFCHLFFFKIVCSNFFDCEIIGGKYISLVLSLFYLILMWKLPTKSIVWEINNHKFYHFATMPEKFSR